MNLESFFNPQSVAVIGVSENSEKLGSIIFQNILEAQFTGKIYAINPKTEGKKISEFFPNIPKNSQEQQVLSKISAIAHPVDLAVIVIPEIFVSSAVDDCIQNKTKNVIIISAGFSEVGNHKLEQEIKEKCKKNNIRLLGPNCLGAIFPFANLNASFADGYPKAGKVCFVSQSGAFCSAILDWAAKKKIGFSHFISLGNKSDISEVDILEALEHDPQVEIFAFYLESLVNGPKFLELIRRISPKKPIIILEPGKSQKAAEAASSHTGSLAPNFRILIKAYEQSGAIQVFSMRAMFGLIKTLVFSEKKNFGNRIAILTNAGGVGVLTTDSVEEENLVLASFSSETKDLLQKNLPEEANTKNPVDIIGDAHADRYEKALKILIEDENVDQIAVLLTPQRTTEVEKTAELVGKISQKTSKNIVASFIGGERANKGIPILEKFGVPSFRFPSEVTTVMGFLARYKQFHEKNKNLEFSQNTSVSEQNEKITRNERIIKFRHFFQEAKNLNLKSLPQANVNQILEAYGFDFPKNENFTDYAEALQFGKSFFQNGAVLKISAPNALHKTDLRGVFLHITSEESFRVVWQNLQNSIKLSGLDSASIQVQEQISTGTEIILGINRDKNFGPVMLFGTGGIYTEVFADTSVRVLPVLNFNSLIDETRIGKILRGVRGEKPKAVEQLLLTIAKMQQLVLDFPEILSIDANPVMVTENRAVCVDFKILV